MRKNKIFEYVKKHKVIISVITIILVLIITGTTLAIYLKSGEGTDKKYTLANINVEYIDGDTIKAENAIPLSDKEIEEYATKKEFKFKNTGDQTLYAEILLTEIEMDESLKSNDFRWELYEEDNKISAGSFINVSDDNTLSLKKGIRVDVESELKNYKILVYIKDNGGNQNDMEETSMKAKIKIKATDKPTEYEDNSGANPPKLAEGMIPVIYDEESDAWVKASTMKKWYDYDNQMWANAVTVYPEASTCNNDSTCVDEEEKHPREYYLNAEVGTPISMDDINTMWVWIPRYKYRIPESIGISANTPPEIDVEFETGLSSTGVSENEYKKAIREDGSVEEDIYYTHPAFRNGEAVYNDKPYDIGGWDAELTGIWVGKFETVGTNDYPLIKPNYKSLIASVSSGFNASLKFTNGTLDNKTGLVTYNKNNNLYGLNTTNNSSSSYTMKNTEWGAVAYLSQSKYGKKGNLLFDEKNREIYVNNSTALYTGRSSGILTQTGVSSGSYSYNDLKCNSTDTTTCTGDKEQYKGTGASTTGTIYGIYDMSGGTSEILMGNYNNRTSSSGFTTLPERKYYDLYTYEMTNSNKENALLGDAGWETIRWYYTSSRPLNSSYPWADRGGDYSSDAIRSIFAFQAWTGSYEATTAFRTVLVP